ncbi:DUF192 domain-containing protein [Pusillimonas sp. MFBS29]|uniref:DUF192 domain-containing protein n=1 Tax=Pusillimonas sp. MFBS29 TaxID=2886690 RepID=UPI001D122066|nr:DUF192 domain-containing protein [Pusillimonas sp. MFBS29]MCC2595420.1 DUF192 domain-containing protein [Pusillimonas sp. MFBS29]
MITPGTPAPWITAHGFTLYKATCFRLRLLGLHATGPLRWHTGLYIAPCNAIHTLALPEPIDVVFLNARHQVLAQHQVKPWRIAWCASATAVVELPAGYCRACPDYYLSIRKALTSG